MKTQKTFGSRLPRLLLTLAIAPALLVIECCAAELTITNHSFENPVLADGASIVGTVPGWTGVGTFQVVNPVDSYFSGTTGTSPSPSPIDGLNALGVNDGGKLIYQDPGVVVQPNVIYTLTLLIGHRIGSPFGNGSMSFWAGAELLAEKFPNPPENSFIASSLTYTSPPSGTAIGKPLRIELRAVGASSQPWFDNLHLFSTNFVCTPHKATATAQLFNGILVGVTITDPGCGYTNAPTVTIQGGGGNGATATALVSDGRVTAINVGNGGCCYTNLPMVVIDSPPRVPTVSIRVSKVIVTQNVSQGRRYVLESSFDLVAWTATGPAFTAQSDTIENEFDVSVTGRFFRLLEAP